MVARLTARKERQNDMERQKKELDNSFVNYFGCDYQLFVLYADPSFVIRLNSSNFRADQHLQYYKISQRTHASCIPWSMLIAATKPSEGVTRWQNIVFFVNLLKRVRYTGGIRL